ncbi:hypothetical protein D8674_024457 [Pyrus ussuriensis x Pyrus communis]|uniref:Uncharacterized protein n=1 Tax=Pyrus ussuriensis x Pyrus communis TaxID=2448454 RepID=A0A5N5H2Z0_9ROSA|nr:hypothetical protein D8674_024457 [Pyrus ussuriensis x Pyrus communis]
MVEVTFLSLSHPFIGKAANGELLIPGIKALGNLAKTFEATETTIIGALVQLLHGIEVVIAAEACIALMKFVSVDNYFHLDHARAIVNFGAANLTHEKLATSGMLIMLHCASDCLVFFSSSLRLCSEIMGERLSLRALVELDQPPFLSLKVKLSLMLSTLEADIRKFACYLQDISFLRIFRESSFVADALTSVGHLSSDVHMRWQNLPVEARPTWFWDFYRHAQLSPVT